MGREVLRRGSVGIRLAFFARFGMLLFHGGRRNCFMMFLEWLALNGGRIIVRSVRLIHDMGFAVVKLLVVRFFVVFAGAGQRFTGKHFHGGAVRGGQRGRGRWRVFLRMPVIIVFEVFEDVANVQESVSVETNVHEGGLHAGKDAGDFSFVDAADESEFFFPLDVNFD